jgi:hypothetical protein
VNAKPLHCRIASTPVDRELVYRLRYLCYLRKGAIEPRDEPRFSDHFDGSLSNFSFLVTNAADPVATVRISVVKPQIGWTESPASSVFSDDPSFQAVARESYVEANRLCFGEYARRDAFVRLLGNMAALADVFSVEWLIACPRVEHVGVYERMFGFRKLAEPRTYFGVNFQTQLLGIRRRELAEYVASRPFIVAAWRDAHSELLGIASALPS